MISKHLQSTVVLGIFLMTLIFTANHAFSRKKEKPDIQTQLQEKYAKIINVKLKSWDSEKSTVITEPDAKSYKVIRTDKSIEHLDKIPEKPEGIKKLYVRKNPSGFSFVMTNKGRQYVWVRLYWSPEINRWQPSHPNSSIFIKEKHKVRDFLLTLNKHFDNHASYRIPVIVGQLKNPRLKEDTRKKYEAELHELTRKVGQSWGGTSLLDAVYDINIKIPAASVEDKVKLAKKRRKILKKIIKKLKTDFKH